MKAHEITVRSLFKGNVRLEVPAFQRRFAWREREFSRLWDDIENLIKGEQSRHFMGTVVVSPEKQSHKFTVIDGQQRLATFSIIFSVLRDLAPDYKAKSFSFQSALKSVNIQKFVPSTWDREAFNHLIDADTTPLLLKTRHRNYWIGRDYFYNKIKSYIDTDKGQRPATFRAIRDAVCERLFVIRILLDSKDDAQSIFETINYTGVPLTAADLARNYALGRVKAKDEQERLHRDYWKKMELNLQESIDSEGAKKQKAQLHKVLPDFLRTVLTVENEKYISFSHLYPELRLFFKKGNIENTLERLVDDSELFRNFLNPEHEKRSTLRKGLQRFLELDMTTHYPILLVIFRAYNQNHITAKDVCKAMAYIESFVVRRSFNSKVSRDLNLVFAQVARDIARHQKFNSLSDILRKSLAAKKWPNDKDFKANFQSTPIYANARQIARFALKSIEEHKSNNFREKVTNKTIQIDHIFPQQPGIGWGKSNLSELKKNLHVMGNLTLTAYNQHYSNRSFKEKVGGKNGLRRSPYWLNKTLRNVKDWGPKEINKRSDRLLRVALLLWPGPRSK
jgi:uncharacterized protein with ParB-like and HNH nuclease domain